MAGPLVAVYTLVAGINLDVSRNLALGDDAVLVFVRPEKSNPDGWAVVKTVTRGFDRISGDESERGDGRSVVFDVVDADEDLADVLRTDDLHLECLGIRYKVADAPLPPSNEAQVFHITCQTRTLRNTYFNNRR